MSKVAQPEMSVSRSFLMTFCEAAAVMVGVALSMVKFTASVLSSSV